MLPLVQERLDRYFQTQFTQNIHRRIVICFVAVEVETRQVMAYYTIASPHLICP